MKTVYIPNLKEGYDISDTAHFGNPAALTEGRVDISVIQSLAAKIVKKLKTAKEDDYLIMGGAPLVNAIAFFYLMNIHGRVNLLIFDARTRKYMARTISEIEVMCGEM